MSRHGYTLVELLIIITITGMLMTFIFSGYTKSQERQAIQQVKEELMSNLQAYQKIAYVGKTDCIGELTGVDVTFTETSVTATPQCSSGASGTSTTKSFTNMVFSPVPASFTFKPLNQGIVFASGTSQDIIYQIRDKQYRIRVENPGTITYEGALP